MQTFELTQNWKMKISGENRDFEGESIPACVPGSVYSNLLKNQMMPDPYYRDNELKALKLMNQDCCFICEFEVPQNIKNAEGILLHFDGIDTLSDVYLNDCLLGKTCNMHRIWEYDIKDMIRDGINELKLIIHSPVKYIKEENEKVYAGGTGDAMEGFPHLRKAHCMFGWDWGPRLPDMGIFRSVKLLGIHKARIDNIYITQTHEGPDMRRLCYEESRVLKSVEVANVQSVRDEKDNERLFVDIDRVIIDAQISVEDFTGFANPYIDFSKDKEIVSKCGYSVMLTATAPDGTVYKQDTDGKIRIDHPMLWWPNGLGSQPLYLICARLFDENGELLDQCEKKIGLRTLVMDVEKDTYGYQFAHQVNGVDFFAMGADYIPEDNLLSRINKERTRRLLEDAVAAGHNCIRVWGGGFYPNDDFYDLCDELGLVVWQDFMYACANYELSDDFEENIRKETIDNVRRIRHHACLGLWCGNNEMEDEMMNDCWQPSEKQRYDYIKLYEYIIPSILKKEDPNRFYWPSSPSSGGNFSNPQATDRGDAHYWDVWHGNKPFTEYRKFRFRYLSEFGFQSFPCMKTIESFTKPEDRNIFSRVMEMHQRNCAANGKILNYISLTYLYPKNFEMLLYASQLLQMEAIRYGVEHFRRHRGNCMGTVVWQLNDIWPVASWSSVDYFGRWKALHYAQKRMFAPVLLSCEETGELSQRPFCVMEPKKMECAIRLCVTNETFSSVKGTIVWQLRDHFGKVIREERVKATCSPLSTLWLEKETFDSPQFDVQRTYLTYWFEKEENKQKISRGTCLFCAPKHFCFTDPKLEMVVHLTKDEKEAGKAEKAGEIIVHSDSFAKAVEIVPLDGDAWFSDNFFDMNPGSRVISILRGDATQFAIRSVYDLADEHPQ